MVAKVGIFDGKFLDLSDMKGGKSRYVVLLFVPSVKTRFCHTARLRCSADATHCHRIGSQCYGTEF